MNIFITGTGTDVGKTVCSAWLCYHLKWNYWKPVQTDCEHCSDGKIVSNIARVQYYTEAYKLPKPLAPYASANLVNIDIKLDKILRLLPQQQNLIIEGAGGIMVPLNYRVLLIDLIVALATPVIVVAHSSLGTINHTCLTVEALKNRNIPLLGVIMNGPINPFNKAAIEHYAKVPVIAEIPFFQPLVSSKLQSHLPSKKLLKKILPVSSNKH